MNHIRFDGKIIKAPITAPTNQGGYICKFVVQSFDKGPGKSSVFFKVVTAGKLASQCQANLSAGMWVYVEGKLHQYTIQNDDGHRENRFEVISFLVYPINKMTRMLSSSSSLDSESGSSHIASHRSVPFVFEDPEAYLTEDSEAPAESSFDFSEDEEDD